MEEVKKTEGIICISHFVECPYCGESMSDDFDKEWWDENITDQLPCNEEYKSTFEPVCKGCKKKFVVDGFVY